MKAYKTESAAQRRVDALVKSRGIWPGIIGPNEHGCWYLTFDPTNEFDASR